MPQYIIKIKMPLGDTKEIIVSGDGLTAEKAVEIIKHQQTIKNDKGIPYMPAGEIEGDPTPTAGVKPPADFTLPV